MKKMLLAMVGILLMVSNVWAYTTYQEAYDVGMLKYLAEDYINAITDFKEALTLTNDLSDKAYSQLRIGLSYELSENYTTAITELEKVPLLIGANSKYIASSYYAKGRCYIKFNNETSAIDSLIEVLKYSDLETDIEDKTETKKLLLKTSNLQIIVDKVSALPLDASIEEFLGDIYVAWTKTIIDPARIVEMKDLQVKAAFWYNKSYLNTDRNDTLTLKRRIEKTQQYSLVNKVTQ